MNEQFEKIIYLLTNCDKENKNKYSICDASEQFVNADKNSVSIAKSINAAFLIALGGKENPLFEQANKYLKKMLDFPDWEMVARFYIDGIEEISNEVESICKIDENFKQSLNSLYLWLTDIKDQVNSEETIEKVWALFFPEATGILSKKRERIELLREKRTVTISELNPNPVTDPVNEIVFTSNILLTVPDSSKSINDLGFSNDLKECIVEATSEQQLFWYDHPVQIGVEPEKNEILYGLRSLDKALEFECERGNKSSDSKLTCVLSASVTHKGLQKIGRRYIEEEFLHTGGLKNIDVYVFTELETKQIIDEILAPAANHYLGDNTKEEVFDMFGVDGEYGRHYSFLKAIAAFWQIFCKPEIKATFKIDLDQVFPQKELVEQSGNSAFDHFKTPLWGAKGLDSDSKPIELGMIAGALVNERDVGKSIFTPDVSFPDRKISPDEHVFFSILPQALSTEGEMMTRYSADKIDGEKKCIERVHVTGGTNGILIESLYRHKPFTPSFIGRAEDQAYILSVLVNQGERLGYFHKEGLIMRHDKEGFAQEAIKSAYIGKLLGDYVRIIYFSKYAKTLTNNINSLKTLVDPFTGCFISKIPLTVSRLRFALKTWSFFKEGKENDGVNFVKNGVQRIGTSIDLVKNNEGFLNEIYNKEKSGWDTYYNVLLELKKAINSKDNFALDLCDKTKKIIAKCHISFSDKQR